MGDIRNDMNENIKQMRERHKKEIETLQDNCKHIEHERMRFMWAPAHSGKDVEVCKFCGKTIGHYRSTTHFGDEFPTNEKMETNEEFMARIMNGNPD
jgi:hypothetical protein